MSISALQWLPGGAGLGADSCRLLAVLMFYCYLAAFCWNGCIAVNVTRTLRAATIQLRVGTGGLWREYAGFSLLGWVFPGLVVAVALITGEHSIITS